MEKFRNKETFYKGLSEELGCSVEEAHLVSQLLFGYKRNALPSIETLESICFGVFLWQ